MNIYYQGNPGSYMHTASLGVAKNLDVKISEYVGCPDFQHVWENIGQDSIAVLAIENSYMGSIHPNLYNFMKYDHKIIGDISLPINHCLCAKESDMRDITSVYSQMPALDQCYKYIQKKGFQSHSYSDTALSAKMVSESEEGGIAAICSELAAELYGLNIIEKNVQDNAQNTTRFVVITPQSSKLTYNDLRGKMSIMLKTKHIPASLYKCLGAFATNNVNLTKIESLPDYDRPFEVNFWIEFEGRMKDENVQSTFHELEFFTTELRILGEY